MTTAILKQLAPMAVIPPSPNTRAWMIKTTETERTAVQGPRSNVIIHAPTAWPVVPPGIGILNIWMRKEKAADIAM